MKKKRKKKKKTNSNVKAKELILEGLFQIIIGVIVAAITKLLKLD